MLLLTGIAPPEIHLYTPGGITELKEIMAIADRIVVLSNGKKTGELTGDEITEDTLVRTSYAGLGTGRNA